MTILDTNVLSEVFKPLPESSVLDWLVDRAPEGLYITAVTLAELLYGVEALPAGRRRAKLSAAIENVLAEQYSGRVLAFDESAARIYADIVNSRVSAGRPISPFDAMIAAIARSRGATLATRNAADFEHCGLKIVNPWTA
jgi:predicted nucleic acid-binding protein